MKQKSRAIDTDIIIAGGGIAGLCLAVLLAGSDMAVALIEPHPPAANTPAGPYSPRTAALMQSSVGILRQAGVWDAIAPVAFPLRAMRIVDDSFGPASRLSLEFPASDIGMEHYGYNVPNDPLRAALYEKAAEHKNIVIHTESFRDCANEGARMAVTLQSGKALRAGLLVGADGKNSKVRSCAGIAAQNHDYGQTALTCTVRHTRPHDSTAIEFHHPAGPLAFVPLAPKTCSVVWIESHEQADAIKRLPKSACEDLLRKQSRDVLGAMTLLSGLHGWPLRAMTTRSCIAPRIALVAEAAHVLSPVTAQGLNLSLRDVFVLWEIIDNVRALGIDIGSASVLAQYQCRRRPDIDTRSFGVDGINRLIRSNSAPVRAARRGLIQTIHALRPLRRFAAREALAAKPE